MATIDNKEIIDTIIKNNGIYPGDHIPVTKIVEYDNQWGGKSTAVVYANEDQCRYEKSIACSNVKIIWLRK